MTEPTASTEALLLILSCLVDDLYTARGDHLTNGFLGTPKITYVPGDYGQIRTRR